jgi:hypothetical protein
MTANDLITLPGMTPDAASRLISLAIRNRTDLHEQICYQPKVVAYIAEVSLQRVTQWLAELERLEAQP